MDKEKYDLLDKATDFYLDDGINYGANTIASADEGDVRQLASDSFFYGAMEIIKNPSKYGLTELKS